MRRPEKIVLSSLRCLLLAKAEDASTSLAAIAAAVASGELTPSEAGELSKVIDAYARALLATELESRVNALERDRK